MKATSVGLPERITIRELGPREGFQIEPTVFPTECKLELISALVACGLPSIEVTSFVRADRVPQLADAEELVARLPILKGTDFSDTEFTALYLNTKGFKRGEATGTLRNKGWLNTAASESFLKANSNITIDGAIAAIPEWLSAFNEAGKPLHGLIVSTAFGCEIEGDIKPASVVKLVERYIKACEDAGAQLKEICLADTVGRGDPETVRMTVRGVRALGVEPSLHLHDTRGLGVANAYAGLLEGVQIFETSIAGLGGCPFTPGAAGNVPTEEVVNLCHVLGVFTGVDLMKCCEAAQTAERIVGHALPGKLYRYFRGQPSK